MNNSVPICCDGIDFKHLAIYKKKKKIKLFVGIVRYFLFLFFRVKIGLLFDENSPGKARPKISVSWPVYLFLSDSRQSSRDNTVYIYIIHTLNTRHKSGTAPLQVSYDSLESRVFWIAISGPAGTVDDGKTFVWFVI